MHDVGKFKDKKYRLNRIFPGQPKTFWASSCPAMHMKWTPG